MSVPLHVAIRNFLKQVDSENKVVSYEYLAIRFDIKTRAILNLLAVQLYDICYVVIGRIKNFYLITSPAPMMMYQLKKLRINVLEVATETDEKRAKAIRNRLKHNLKSLTEKRLIDLSDVYSEELMKRNLI